LAEKIAYTRFAIHNAPPTIKSSNPMAVQNTGPCHLPADTATTTTNTLYVAIATKLKIATPAATRFMSGI
jgi:hypothetical protein